MGFSPRKLRSNLLYLLTYLFGFQFYCINFEFHAQVIDQIKAGRVKFAKNAHLFYIYLFSMRNIAIA